MPRGKRASNIFWETAKAITDIMCGENPDARVYNGVFGQNRAQLSRICNPKKAQGGKVYPPLITFSAWKWYRNKLLEVGYASPSLSALLKGDPCPIEQYLKGVLDEMPPVFLSQAHDDYVREHAEALRYLGFRYGGWLEADDQYSGKRLRYEEVERLGLLP